MLKYFSIFYYTVPVQIGITLLFVISALIHYRKIREFRSLLLYGIVSLLQCILGTYISAFTKYTAEREIIIQNSINIFMLFEYIVFSHFIISSIRSAIIKWVLKLISAGFVIAVFHHWIFTPAFNRSPASLTVLESYLIIIGCLFYYFEIFISPPNIKLLQHPRFWIITGMLFLFAFLIPLFLQRNNELLNFADLFNAVYMMNFIGYIILFVFFNIGLKCQIRRSI